MRGFVRRAVTALALALAIGGVLAGPAIAVHDGDADATGMTQLFNLPNSSVPQAINSDLAFWGNRAFAGNYDGFRIFDISNPASPALLSDFKCHGPQNDPVVWGHLMFLAVDRTQSGPQCGSTDVAHGDPNGWEGVRIFDVGDPRSPRQIGAVYTDCGAHTITLYPKNAAQILLYVSSYPLRPGPTCGPVNGPPAGNSPLHEKISVIRVPVHNPGAAKVIAQPRISYPGDPDNKFTPSEHGLTGPELLDGLTACHDIGVFVELRLAAAACAEQAQLWRIKPNGIPDTEHPLWVYDDNADTDGPGSPGTTGDVAVDFWHSATFSWDGKVVNFIDESFGEGCPTVTKWADGSENDTGRMFFLDTASGTKLSHLMIPRSETPVPAPDRTYCSAHVGFPVHSPTADLLVNAWYTGGADVIDFNDPAHPFEATYFDAGNGAVGGSDNWTAYWYEGPGLGHGTLTMYGQDGVEHPPSGLGFQVFKAFTDVRTIPLPFLNPQTQMSVLGARFHAQARPPSATIAPDRGRATAKRGATLSGRAARAATRRLAP
jgi:LVIVD repeat